MRTACFFGGVARTDPTDVELARAIGHLLGSVGLRLLHGGYNGLMEVVAAGAARSGAEIVAITHAGMEWGSFNDSVATSVRLPSLGARLDRFLNDTDLVVAMGGGIGTLHELTAAVWYAGNVREIPVVLAGRPAVRLAAFLRRESWLFESPTRSLGFLHTATDGETFARTFDRITAGRVPGS